MSRFYTAMTADDLRVTDDGKAQSIAQLTFTVAGYLPGGRLQTYPPGPINLNLTPEQREKASRDGLRLGHDVTVGDGVGRIRRLVEDRYSRNIGTLTIPIGN